MELDKMRQLFNATAEATSEVDALRAFKAFAAALTTPILQAIELESIMRGMFAVERLAPGAQPIYPIASLSLAH